MENITIFKDAAAAYIWGQGLENGVIVITTIQGKFSPKTAISLTGNVSVVEMPDLFHYPQMSVADFIDNEIFLFNKGYYNVDLNNLRRPALTPVVELLAKKRAGTISSADSARQINAFKQQGVRNDFDWYIYRTGVLQQHALNLDGEAKISVIQSLRP